MDTMNYIEHITENLLDWNDIKSKTTMDFMDFMDNTENINIQTIKILTIIQKVDECYEESYMDYKESIMKENDENV